MIGSGREGQAAHLSTGDLFGGFSEADLAGIPPERREQLRQELERPLRFRAVEKGIATRLGPRFGKSI